LNPLGSLTLTGADLIDALYNPYPGLTTLYSLPEPGGPVPTLRVRVVNNALPCQAIELPAFNERRLLALNPQVLSFPGAVRTGEVHTNLILSYLVPPDLSGNQDPLLLEIAAYDTNGNLLDSMDTPIEFERTLFFVDVLGQLGVPSLADGSIVVTKKSGSGAFWGVAPTVYADGGVSVATGLQP
jgi:hypothetical protein